MDEKKNAPSEDEELLAAREKTKKQVWSLSLEALEQVTGGLSSFCRSCGRTLGRNAYVCSYCGSTDIGNGDERDVVENADNMYALLGDVDGWDATQ